VAGQKVSAELCATLESLFAAFGGATAFVSGRPIADIDRLFHPLRFPAVGGHGVEIRLSPNSDIRRSTIATLDDDLRAAFARIGRIGDGVIVEDKGYSLAIHYRLAPTLGGEMARS
jgi:trehalose 6-phosphate phosphatase